MAKNQYISNWNKIGWLVRVPTSYTEGENPKSLFQFAEMPKKLQYSQRLFKYADYTGSASIALQHAKQWRDENKMKGLTYKDYKARGNNRRFISSRTRIRGNDLPTGITESQQMSKNGINILRLITVQVMVNGKSFTKSFSYGFIRDRDQAVALAKDALCDIHHRVEQEKHAKVR